MRFENIKKLEHAKRGLEVAAAGGHNVQLVGPNGSGKNTLAEAYAKLFDYDEMAKLSIVEIMGINNPFTDVIDGGTLIIQDFGF
jgi:magnesium chelatase family protein